MGSSNRSRILGMVGVLSTTLAAALSVVACGGSDNGGGNSAGSGGSTSNAGSSSGGNGNGGSVSMTGAGTSSTGGNGQAGSTGAGGSTGGTGISTGLPADKPLNMLTDGELQTLCSNIAKEYSTGAIGKGMQDFSCAFTAIFATELSQPKTDADAQATCKKSYGDCEMKPLDQTPGKCDKPDSTCTATVGELDACQKDMLAYVAQLKSLFPSCDTVTLMQLGDNSMPTVPQAPASCQALEEKCPEIQPPTSMMP